MLKKLLASIPHILAPGRLAIPVAALVLAIGLAGCSSTSESGLEAPEGSEGGESGEGSEGGGEAGESGGEGGEPGGGGGEENPTQYLPTATYDMVDRGAHLILRYDATNGRFTGTVTNDTNATLSRVRVEVHLATPRGTHELGPTEPTDLAPGETLLVGLPATGNEDFTAWGGIHVERGGTTSINPDSRTYTFAPSLGAWAVKGGVELGVEHQGHGLSAEYTRQGSVWTPGLSPSAPEHQPTEPTGGTATWTGEWAGYHESSPAIATGAANVTVTWGTGAAEAALALEDVPTTTPGTLRTLEWNAMSVSDGRFTGSTMDNSQTYDATGQFGGANQAGVAGYAEGPDFQSVFYGDKP